MNRTEVTCLTPQGAGAIAVLALRGPAAGTIVRRLFRPASKKPLPESPRPGSTWLGRLGDGAGDEVIVVTPHPAHPPRRGAGWGADIEIHCHGGAQVVRWLTEQFVREGCVRVDSFLPADDPWALLPHAKTLRTAAILLDQANGAFARGIAAIGKELQSANDAEATRHLNELAQYIPVGRHLTEPWRIAIAGAPNAGKSSLLNALAGYQRSIVAPVPGTTRDVVTTTLAFDGWPVQLSDTAGLRDSPDVLEREGVHRAHAEIAAADLCLWVIDATGPAPSSAAHFATEVGIAPSCVLPLVNKIDLPPAWDVPGFRGAVPVSAMAKIGLEELMRQIVTRLVPHEPPPGASVPYWPAACELVEATLKRLAAGQREAATAALACFRDDG